MSKYIEGVLAAVDVEADDGGPSLGRVPTPRYREAWPLGHLVEDPLQALRCSHIKSTLCRVVIREYPGRERGICRIPELYDSLVKGLTVTGFQGERELENQNGRHSPRT